MYCPRMVKQIKTAQDMQLTVSLCFPFLFLQPHSPEVALSGNTSRHFGRKSQKPPLILAKLHVVQTWASQRWLCNS